MTSPKRSVQLSRDEIRAVYAQGEEAVLALIEGLLQQIEQLEARIEAVENKQQKNSRNSSKPPSSDGFGKRTQSLRPKSERQSGGQPGHPGDTLAWVEQADEIEVHPVSECEVCGASLSEVAVESLELRQVHDLLPLRLQVMEHQVEVKSCPHCQTLNRGRFPVDVNSVTQYGSGIKGLMVYLMEYQLLPAERTCQLLADLFGCSISQGTLYNSRQHCFEGLASIEQQTVAALQQSHGVEHFDETGVHIKGKLAWLHVVSTEMLTSYFVHAKRGQVAIDEINILPQFRGVSVHDGWQSYRQYDHCEHSLCNAHHLRELRFIAERYGQAWADEMKQHLLDIKAQVEQAQDQGEMALSAQQLSEFAATYQAIIERGLAANPPTEPPPDAPKPKGRPKQHPAKNLLDRLQSQQAAVLAFMNNFAIPFDNNQAERDLRMVKLKEKISGGFRSPEGARQFCRIRGYISTLKKQGLNLLEALKNVFLGQPTLPSFQPE